MQLRVSRVYVLLESVERNDKHVSKLPAGIWRYACRATRAVRRPRVRARSERRHGVKRRHVERSNTTGRYGSLRSPRLPPPPPPSHSTTVSRSPADAKRRAQTAARVAAERSVMPPALTMTPAERSSAIAAQEARAVAADAAERRAKLLVTTTPPQIQGGGAHGSAPAPAPIRAPPPPQAQVPLAVAVPHSYGAAPRATALSTFTLGGGGGPLPLPPLPSALPSSGPLPSGFVASLPQSVASGDALFSTLVRLQTLGVLLPGSAALAALSHLAASRGL